MSAIKNKWITSILVILAIFAMAGIITNETSADGVIFHSPPPCELETRSGDIKVDFGGQYLLTVDPAYPRIIRNTSIPAGTYDVYLQSFDGYNTRGSVTQPHEQYYVLFNGSGELKRSNATPDLEDYKERAYWKGQVSDNLHFSKKIDQVIAKHRYEGDGSTGANSVRAICMVLRLEQVCGDGVKNSNEQCDDGNKNSGDGCSSSCQIEIQPFCGDGHKGSNEQCDDGNKNSGDGCSSSCQIEIQPFCGDGIKQSNEQCDDGNKSSGDGCSAACQVEIAPFCGDKIRQIGEDCDDGNKINGDGCSSVCRLEKRPFCGDGIKDNNEQCDDGNSRSGDGCSAGCQKENPVPFCGDGHKNSNESCDDGNSKSGDGCDFSCNIEENEEDEEEEKCESSIGDEVWFDANKNGHRDSGEKGISGVTLKLIFGNKVEKDTTDSSGEYKFDDLCKGSYTVIVDANDIPDGCYQTADPDAKMDNTDKIELGKDDKYRKADFGYFCPGTQKVPATGPGTLVMGLSAGLAGMSLVAIKKGKNIITYIKNWHK